MVDAGHTERENLVALAFSHKKIGAVLLQMSRFPEAAGAYRAALALDEKVLAMDPTDPTARFDITFTLSDTGYTYWKQGDRPKALQYYRQVLAIREALLKDDPSNVRVKWGVAGTYNYIGNILQEQGHWREAIPYHERSIEVTGALLKGDPDNAGYQVQLAWRHLGLGRAFALGAMWPQAAASDRDAMSLVAALKARKALPGDLEQSTAQALAAAEAKLPAAR